MKEFSNASDDFRLTISLKKTENLTQDTEAPPTINLDFTITSNLSLDSELDKRIGKAASTMARLIIKVWSNADVNQDDRLESISPPTSQKVPAFILGTSQKVLSIVL